MSLRHEPDVSQAAWFTVSTTPWHRLCSIGPSGFERYGRLFHPLRDGVENNRDDLANVEGHLDPGSLTSLTAHLGRHTSTPDDCFFALWDGFGDIHGSPSVTVLADRGEQRIPPAFPPEVLAGPRVEIPGRTYLLFRGALAEAGDWGAADLLPGRPRTLNSPNLMWPADHAWFVASEIDLPWTGIAGAKGLLEDLVADPALDAQPVAPSGKLPYWRS